ncbi:MAG: anti-anti-sigma factor [Bacteroidetes bacterium GWF2_49_14]|nr:MAG: anti-anti-sigma factor [Bacteroidetes bacterium GWF2_49_14]HBB92824.1 anti-sigma factor antagonist [Bacteroidales bacterium]
MDISVRDLEGIKAIDISGILDTNTSPAAETFIQNLLDQENNRLIINLKNTDYLSSSGLRVLLATAKKLWAIGGKLKIACPNKVVTEILDTSGFSMILDIRETEGQALSEM